MKINLGKIDDDAIRDKKVRETLIEQAYHITNNIPNIKIEDIQVLIDTVVSPYKVLVCLKNKMSNGLYEFSILLLGEYKQEHGPDNLVYIAAEIELIGECEYDTAYNNIRITTLDKQILYCNKLYLIGDDIDSSKAFDKRELDISLEGLKDLYSREIIFQNKLHLDTYKLSIFGVIASIDNPHFVILLKSQEEYKTVYTPMAIDVEYDSFEILLDDILSRIHIKKLIHENAKIAAKIKELYKYLDASIIIDINTRKNINDALYKANEAIKQSRYAMESIKKEND